MAANIDAHAKTVSNLPWESKREIDLCDWHLSVKRGKKLSVKYILKIQHDFLMNWM